MALERRQADPGGVLISLDTDVPANFEKMRTLPRKVVMQERKEEFALQTCGKVNLVFSQRVVWRAWSATRGE